MRKNPVVTVLCLLGGVLAAGATPVALAGSTCRVGVLLPGEDTGKQWGAHRRELANDFKAARVTACISRTNDPRTQSRQASEAMSRGAKVLVLAGLRSPASVSIEARAASKGVTVIDYDRLTPKGAAAYFVSFDNESIGKLQAQALQACLRTAKTYNTHPLIAQLNGPPDDIGAALMARGFNDVLEPLYASGTFRRGPIVAVPQWTTDAARGAFRSMVRRTGRTLGGMVTADDRFAHGAISVITAKHLRRIPIGGQGATFQGIRNIVGRSQCATMYKPAKWQADAASNLAISLLKGKDPVGINAKINDGARDVPSVLVPVVPITKRNYFLMFSEGIYRRTDVCGGSLKRLCF